MAGHGAPLWTEAKTAELRRLIKIGLLPSAIAPRLDTTRRAVIGKACRLGLKFRQPTPAERQQWSKASQQTRKGPIDGDAVARLAADGLSATKIGRAVGRSHNSILGYCRRNGVQLFGGVGGRPKATKEEHEARIEADRIKRAAKKKKHFRLPSLGIKGMEHGKQLAASLPAMAPCKPTVSIEDATRRHCRYIGERPELITAETPVFCGAPTDGRSWCPAHRAVAFKPVPTRAQVLPIRR